MNVISPAVGYVFFLALGFVIGILVLMFFRRTAVSHVNTIVDTVNSGLWVVDPQFKIVFVNAPLAAKLGYAPQEMVGRPTADFIAAPQETSGAAYLEQLRSESATFTDIPFRHKDGSIIWASVSASPATGKDNQRIGSLLLIVNDTGRKQTEIALKQANNDLTARVDAQNRELQVRQAELNAVLGAMGEGVFYSKGQYISYANRALEEMSGYTSGELVGKLGRILLTTDMAAPDAIDIVAAVRQGAFNNPNRVWRGETKLMRKDGTTYDGALTFTLLVDAEEKIIGAVCVARDISEQKRLESQKSAFVANASHELRTPLTNLQSRLYLLAKQPENFNQHVAALQKIGNRMQQLVEDLLDVSRFERGIIPISLQDIPLQDLLHEAVQTQSLEAQQKTISMDYKAPELPAYVLADRDRLMQVIINLITNAINYTPAGGNISVSLEIDEDRDAVIRVQDSGIGIAVENLDRVFEPFFRASERVGRGTGLGLSISKAIIELHGGSLSVESTVNKGSTFTVRLALSRVNA